MSLDVVTVGESMVLFVAEQAGPLREATSFRRHIAGAESNVAIGLCRLGQTAGWVSRLGDDEFGRAILFRVRGEGVDTSRVVLDAVAPTAVVFRDRREVGPIDVIYYRRGSAASRLNVSDLDPEYIRRARFVHLTGITPALSDSCRETVLAAAEIARSAGVRVVFDPNYRSKLWDRDQARKVMLDLVARADIVLPGLDEAELLTGEAEPEAAARSLAARGPSCVIVKVGARGAVAMIDDRLIEARPMPLDRIVDPVGAGDAFAAGLLAGLLREFEIEAALDLANRCGRHAMLSPGDVEGLPRWDEVAGPAWSGDVRR